MPSPTPAVAALADILEAADSMDRWPRKEHERAASNAIAQITPLILSEAVAGLKGWRLDQRGVEIGGVVVSRELLLAALRAACGGNG